MRVVLVVVIAVAWLVILAPGFFRRRSASGETDSISHFHQQLRVLEHSAPNPIVAPAYRLCGADDSIHPRGTARRSRRCSAWSAPATCPGRRSPFWPRTPAAAAIPNPPHPGWRRPTGRATCSARPPPPSVVAPRGARRLTRQRRRDTLSVLVLALVTSFMIGFVPGAVGGLGGHRDLRRGARCLRHRARPSPTAGRGA